MEFKSGCKINLYLKVGEKRADGYHELETIFYPLSEPFDVLDITEGKEEGLRVFCDTPGIDLEKNTLTKAYNLYKEATGFAPSLEILLKKGVPHGAGLGGGSADAACLLQYLERENPKPLGFSACLSLAAKVGADVPFFLYNEPCHAKGIGEILTPVSVNLKDRFLVLVHPHLHVSTAWAFNFLDERKKMLTGGEVLCINRHSQDVGEYAFHNDFEYALFDKYLGLRLIKSYFTANGAQESLLSGSGSSLFALFDKREVAQRVVENIKKEKFTDILGLDVYGPYGL